MAGMDKSKVMKRGGKKTKVKKMGRGKKTSMQGGVEHYQDYVKRMFGGGVTKKGGGVTSNQPAQQLAKIAPPTLGGPSKPPNLRKTRTGAGLGKGITGRPLGKRPKKAVIRRKAVFRPTKADDRGL